VNVTAFVFFNMMVLKLLLVRGPSTLVRLERRSPEIIKPAIPYPSVIFYRAHLRWSMVIAWREICRQRCQSP